MNDGPKGWRSIRAGGLWIVLDKDDNPFGPFDNAKAAAEWAEKKWPSNGHVESWAVVALREPD